MKKIVTSLFFTAIIYYAGHSQLQIGVKAGINYGNLVTTQVPFDYGDQYANLLSYRGGITLSYPYKKWSVSSGFLLSARGTCAKSYFYPGRVPQIYGFFEIPLTVSRFIYSDKLELGLGLVYAIDGGRSDVLIGDTNTEIDLQLGLTWHFNHRFSVEASYLFGGIDNYISKRETYLYSVGNLSLNYNFANISFSKKHK